mmetsp:Transcript_20482/g.65976  ORF Transcript_20482/g.65976 Transcript_20482/m.65976 type:complete len:372 (-) Transcript_20482:19-1134(-)
MPMPWAKAMGASFDEPLRIQHANERPGFVERTNPDAFSFARCRERHVASIAYSSKGCCFANTGSAAGAMNGRRSRDEDRHPPNRAPPLEGASTAAALSNDDEGPPSLDDDDEGDDEKKEEEEPPPPKPKPEPNPAKSRVFTLSMTVSTTTTLRCSDGGGACECCFEVVVAKAAGTASSEKSWPSLASSSRRINPISLRSSSLMSARSLPKVLRPIHSSTCVFVRRRTSASSQSQSSTNFSTSSVASKTRVQKSENDTFPAGRGGNGVCDDLRYWCCARRNTWKVVSIVDAATRGPNANATSCEYAANATTAADAGGMSWEIRATNEYADGSFDLAPSRRVVNCNSRPPLFLSSSSSSSSLLLCGGSFSFFC